MPREIRWPLGCGHEIKIWSGIDDGRFSGKNLISRVRNDEKMLAVRERILTTDVLFIDEISMLSAKLMQDLHTVLCAIRGSSFAFGGMQIICSGDFYQLPPVPSERTQDPGQFAFEADVWQQTFHKVLLTVVHRQCEERMIEMVNQVAKGSADAQTLDLITSLSEPLPELEEETVHLFATNLQVDDYNTSRLLQLPGDCFCYEAADAGDAKLLTSREGILAPKELLLKPGCTVMLLRNLSSDLVNGSLGHVLELTSSGPVVAFQSSGHTLKMTRYKFTVFDPTLGKDLATREQFPLKLAYGLTIHKSQGMTLKSVSVDCQFIFAPGQLGVALGRATTLSGLQVKGFHAKHIIQQPERVHSYYKTDMKNYDNDMSCCRPYCDDRLIHMEEPDELVDGKIAPQDDTDDVDVEDLLLCDVDNLDDFDMFDGDEYNTELVTLINLAKYKQEVTQFHKEANDALDKLHQNLNIANRFYKTQIQKLEEHYKIKKGTQSEFTNFYADIHNYVISKHYQRQVATLFNLDTQCPVQETHSHAAHRFMGEIRTHFLKMKAQDLPVASGPTTRVMPDSVEALSDTERGKVRYVGGFSVAKVRYNMMAQWRRLATSTDLERRELIKHLNSKIQLLDIIIRSQSQIITESHDVGSLQVTIRKQNLRSSLTHITDDALQFFTTLCSRTLQIQSHSAINLHGANLYHFTCSELHKDSSLLEQFFCLFSPEAEYSHDIDTHICDLYKDVVKRFLSVMTNQRRKDFLSDMKTEKQAAHRQQIMKKTSKQSKNLKQNTMNQATELPSVRKSGRSTVVAEADRCKECQQGEEDGEQWIMCDYCGCWYHRVCAELLDDEEWEEVQAPDAKFRCHLC